MRTSLNMHSILLEGVADLYLSTWGHCCISTTPHNFCRRSTTMNFPAHWNFPSAPQCIPCDSPLHWHSVARPHSLLNEWDKGGEVEERAKRGTDGQSWFLWPGHPSSHELSLSYLYSETLPIVNSSYGWSFYCVTWRSETRRAVIDSCTFIKAGGGTAGGLQSI